MIARRVRLKERGYRMPRVLHPSDNVNDNIAENVSAWPSLLDAVAGHADARGWAALDDLTDFLAGIEIAEALGFVVREHRYGREFVVLTPIGRGVVSGRAE